MSEWKEGGDVEKNYRTLEPVTVTEKNEIMLEYWKKLDRLSQMIKQNTSDVIENEE